MLTIRRVVGDSMQPTLAHGDIVIAVRKKPKIGNIVIARNEGREVIKRVKRITSPTLVYLLGDNAEKSTDSRHYGNVDATSLLGVVIKTYKSKK